MDEREALHTAARRYCFDVLPELTPGRNPRTYHEPELPVQLPKAQGTKAQWEIIPAILIDVESLRPTDFPSAEALRHRLIEIGQTVPTEQEQLGEPVDFAELGFDEDELAAEDEKGDGEDDDDFWDDDDEDFWSDEEEPAEDPEETARAIREERERFCNHIQYLSPEVLLSVEPLPYRRVLNPEEATRLLRQLSSRWHFQPDEFYWWPLVGDTAPRGAVAFNTGELMARVPLEALRASLADQGVRRVFKLIEYGPASYEMDLEMMRPMPRQAAESYWTSQSLDWVIYLSHEDSITIGGDALLALIEREWPGWRDHLRTTHIPPSVPGLRGGAWYRTLVAVRFKPRAPFESAAGSLAAALEQHPNVRAARAWWDADARKMMIELEHSGETGEKASLAVEEALAAAVDATGIAWKEYEPRVVDVREVS